MSALYKTAGRLARRAVAADKERDWTNAITLYMLACEYLIGAAKHDRIPTRREMIKQRISAYLTRTEELKALVCPAAAPQASTTPAASQYNPVSNRAAVGEDRVLPKEFTAAGGDGIGWDDVGGLEGAKDVLDEALVFPQKHPELFKGKRQPWKGVLLFGPPGTGKTLVVKAAAKECGLPVAFISASDLVSKWQGQSERALKQLFENARRTKPCVIFVDEIDSIGRTRQEGEHESARRLKTELLRQLDGVGANNDGVTFIAATNTPWELDPALRRRFDQMVYMPLPDAATREKVLRIHLEGQDSVVTPADFAAAAARAKGYSAADLQIVAREALMLPIRRALKSKYFKQVSVQPPGEMWKRTMWVPATKWERGAKRKHMLELDPESVLVGQVSGKDLQAALASVAPSVSQEELRRYEEFKTKFRARDGAARSGARVALRGASAAARTTGVAAGAGVGAGAGAGSARVPTMPDAPTGGLLSSFANAIAGWFSSAPAPAPAVPPRSASSNGRRLVPG